LAFFSTKSTIKSLNEQKQRQLFDYAAEGKLKHVKRLLEENVDVNVTDYDRRYKLNSKRGPDLEVYTFFLQIRLAFGRLGRPL
jgi:hypothetical protein